MKLTDMRETKRGRLALYFDEEFWASVAPELVVQMKLRIGDVLEEDALEALLLEAQFCKAKEKALSLLGYRAYGARELERRLERYEFPPEVCAQAVERMRELGLIDDARFAGKLARELCLRRGLGQARARQEMRQRGLLDEDIEQALSELPDNTLLTIREFLEKKYALCWEDEGTRRRAFAALQRRGYRFDEIRGAFSLEEQEVEELRQLSEE